MAIRELQRWSDHMLTDIGLTRGMIPAAVDGIMRREKKTKAEEEPASGVIESRRSPARPRQHETLAAGLTVVRPASPKAECC